jgi:hypothetical protein
MKKRLRKTLSKLKCKDRVEVRWLDACSPGDPKWHEEDEFAEWCKEDLPIRDLGYILKIDKKHLTLVGGYSDNKDFTTLYHRELKIPLGCVVSVKKLG